MIRQLTAAPAGEERRPQESQYHCKGRARRWTEYEQLAMQKCQQEGKRVHHVVAQIDPQCAMPIAGRQLMQNALAGIGEVLALRPRSRPVPLTSTQVEILLATSTDRPSRFPRSAGFPRSSRRATVEHCCPRSAQPAVRSEATLRSSATASSASEARTTPTQEPASVVPAAELHEELLDDARHRHQPRARSPKTCCAWTRSESTACSIWSAS